MRPTRKPNRLEAYDYTSPGYYHVVFCTQNRECLLGTVTKSDEAHASELQLSAYGKAVEEALFAIPGIYHGVWLEKYVIMPNHVHLILAFSDVGEPLPHLSRVIQQTKRRVSVRVGRPIWQTHYYDQIIRSEAEYRDIWEYIENNPTKWSLDQYYSER